LMHYFLPPSFFGYRSLSPLFVSYRSVLLSLTLLHLFRLAFLLLENVKSSTESKVD
jgi:hypothetical protein